MHYDYTSCMHVCVVWGTLHWFVLFCSVLQKSSGQGTPPGPQWWDSPSPCIYVAAIEYKVTAPWFCPSHTDRSVAFSMLICMRCLGYSCTYEVAGKKYIRNKDNLDFFLMCACMQVEVHVCTCACVSVNTCLHVHGEPVHVCMCMCMCVIKVMMQLSK